MVYKQWAILETEELDEMKCRLHQTNKGYNPARYDFFDLKIKKLKLNKQKFWVASWKSFEK